MALKPDRIELLTDISFFSNAACERGGVVSAVTSDEAIDISNDDALFPNVRLTLFKYKFILAGKLLNSTSIIIII